MVTRKGLFMKYFKPIVVMCFIALQGFAYAEANQKIDDLAHAFMAKNHVEGMSIAVINNGNATLLNYGYANEIKKTPTTSSTIYRIASFSKTYTATLAVNAAVEGKIDLNSAMTKYLPDMRANRNLNNITLNMLLAHVSSLPFNFIPEPETYSDAIKDLVQLKPSGFPGSGYQYSNLGIGLTGYILQNSYSESYDQLLAQKIARPLNLTSTYLNLPIAKESMVALGHEGNNKIRPYDRDLDVWFAAASLKSSISDMAKFLDAQMNYNSLQDKTLAKAIVLMHQNKYCFTGGRVCEQLGWQAHIISELNNSVEDSLFKGMDKDGIPTFETKSVTTANTLIKNKVFIDKSCGGYGMSGYMAYIPMEKVAVVILLNKTVGAQRIRLGRDILKTLTK